MTREERVNRLAQDTGNICPEQQDAPLRPLHQHRCIGCAAESGTLTTQEDGTTPPNACGRQRIVPPRGAGIHQEEGRRNRRTGTSRQ